MSSRRWDFISANRADFGVQRICRVLGASRAGYYRHLATEQARAGHQAEEKRTVSEIRAIHAEHQGAYGAPRVHAELRARGRRINRWGCPRLRGSVTRLMAGVSARISRPELLDHCAGAAARRRPALLPMRGVAGPASVDRAVTDAGGTPVCKRPHHADRDRWRTPRHPCSGCTCRRAFA